MKEGRKEGKKMKEDEGKTIQEDQRKMKEDEGR
jgi:hypothetical protein